MIITGRQLRGARGLLGWSIEDLVEQTDVNRITIRQIEADEVQPQEKTLSKILSVLDKHGIEFLPEEGVKVRKQEARTYSGKAGFRQLLDHFYDTLKNGGRIRQFNFGDLRYLSYSEGYIEEHLQRMSSIKGLDAKVLDMPGETVDPVDYCEYRYLEKAFKDMTPWYLYGDYVVFSLNESGSRKEFITIYSKLLAEHYVKEFDIFWNMAALRKKAK